jgi:hypothetical protein
LEGGETLSVVGPGKAHFNALKFSAKDKLSPAFPVAKKKRTVLALALVIPNVFAVASMW